MVVREGQHNVYLRRHVGVPLDVLKDRPTCLQMVIRQALGSTPNPGATAADLAGDRAAQTRELSEAKWRVVDGSVSDNHSQRKTILSSWNTHRQALGWAGRLGSVDPALHH